MKHKNGFHYFHYLLPKDLHSLYYDLRFKEDKRDPRLAEMVQTSPLVWERKNKDLYAASFARCQDKARAILPRLERFKAYREAQNRAHLATLTPEQAQEAFFMKADEGGGSCLKWYEQLPCGIDYQAASNATGITFFLEWWEGNVRRSWEYSPNAKKPRKFRQVAKAI